MVALHPTAVIDPAAELAADVTVGPYSVIGGQVRIGAGSRIGPHVVLEGRTTLGAGCRVSAGTVIGSPSQDLKFDGIGGVVEIGDRTTIREFVTVNVATRQDGATRIGRDALVMAYAHVAHDCLVGDHVILANAATLGGHVTIESLAIVGGLVGIHQFVRIGTLAIIGGHSKVVQDVPPYLTADGHPAAIHGINVIGLRRAGVSAEARLVLKRCCRILTGAGEALPTVIARLEAEVPSLPEVQRFLAFLKSSHRGVTR